MKDLKHLIYFENLLQDANNELIAQAKSEGKRCVAYVCENVPEPLLNLAGTFSIRLRAPRTGSMEMATTTSPASCANTPARCSSGPSRAASSSPTAS